jgi:hypothetical protein
MKEKERKALWFDLLLLPWEMRWQLLLLGIAWVGIHFAVEYADALFPSRKPLTLGDVCLLSLFGGMIVYGYSSDTRKRVEKLEETVERLQKQLKG